jgi:hypothetical protein
MSFPEGASTISPQYKKDIIGDKTNPKDLLKKGNVNGKERANYWSLAIAIGVILCLGGIFLTLAAHQVLPHGVNAISDLGVWGQVAGYGGLGIGFMSALIGAVKCYLNKHTQVDDSEPTPGNKEETKKTDSLSALASDSQKAEDKKDGNSAKQMDQRLLRILTQYSIGNFGTEVDIDLYRRIIPEFEKFCTDEQKQKTAFRNPHDIKQTIFVDWNQFGVQHRLHGDGLPLLLIYLVLTGKIYGFSTASIGFRVELRKQEGLPEGFLYTNESELKNPARLPEPFFYTKESLTRIDDGLQKIALPKKEDFPQKQQQKVGEALKKIQKEHYWRLQGKKNNALDLSVQLFRHTDEEDQAILDELVKRNVIKAWNVMRADRILVKLADDDQTESDIVVCSYWRDLAMVKKLDEFQQSFPTTNDFQNFPEEQRENIGKALKAIKRKLFWRVLSGNKDDNKALELSQSLDQGFLNSLVKKGVIQSWSRDHRSIYAHLGAG